MKLTVKNVLFRNVTAKADKNGVLYYHAYLNELGTRDSMCVNIDESFRTRVPECACDVVLDYRFSVVEKNGVKNYYHNFDVCEILNR